MVPNAIRFVAAGVAAILAFDVIASAASRVFAFPYVRATWGSFAIYFLIGLTVARATPTNPVQQGAMAAAIAGVAEASLGWALSWMIGPGRLSGDRALTISGWLTAVIFVVVVALVLGAIGGVVGRGMRPPDVAVP